MTVEAVEERNMQQENPVDIALLRPLDITPEDAEAWKKRGKVLESVRQNYVNKEGIKLSDGGEQDEWAAIVGRFQPFHPGYSVLFEAANIAAKNILVVIGSSNRIDARNPFPAADREALIRLYYQERGFSGNLEFIYQDDLFGEHPGSTDGPWMDQLLDKAKQKEIEIDVLMSNRESTWVNGIFKNKGKRVYELLDTVSRGRFSATAKRAELGQHLKPGVNRVQFS